ncbi:transcription factor kayak isoform X3 [Cydia fagiglandana]|uniref:transcription factor kayak isoform X3 n=1 Tax=Cydia fagiglandana TaxID=1458189 RepID=UPI002FEE2291
MTMKLDVSDSQSNHSESNDSQSSQDSSNDFMATIQASRSLLTLANLEGLQSGVPTRTTATITPTQLRNFEQTYIELSNCHSEQANHAGFVPPSVTHANSYGILNPGGYCDAGPTTALHVSPGPLSASGDSSCSPGPAPKRRNMGGRRPTKAPQDISPEEEERRKIRRERNKMAAARCRKRRLDHTNELQDETDKLEEKKHALQEEIRKLNADKDQLQTILQTHLRTCKLARRAPSPPDVKPFEEYPYIEEGVRVKEEVVDPAHDPSLALDNDVMFTSPTPDKRIMLSAASPAMGLSLDTPPVPVRPSRPNFLQIHNNKAIANNKIAGIEISTPSNGIPFNFDSLMEGGTGLTPVHPHPLAPHPHPLPHPCAQQQRAAPDQPSPDHGSLVSL